jgi:tetratricopeptide (TPR) repeat protein
MSWLKTCALALVFTLAAVPALAENDLLKVLRMGAQAMQDGQASGQEQRLRQEVMDRPNDHRAWYRLAKHYYNHHRYDQALKVATKAISLLPPDSPREAEYYAGRAWACYKTGLFEQAELDMQRAVDLAPGNRQYQKWLQGARQANAQRGPGRSLADVLGYDPGEPAASAQGRVDPAGEEPYWGEAEDYREDVYREEGEPGRGDGYQAEGESIPEERAAGAHQEEAGEAGAGGEAADPSELLAELSPNCRKGYYSCMAECAGIAEPGPREICEGACLRSAQSCR